MRVDSRDSTWPNVCFILGFLTGMLFMAILLEGRNKFYLDNHEVSKEYQQMLSICEKDLPRSVKCVLIATPENNQGS